MPTFSEGRRRRKSRERRAVNPWETAGQILLAHVPVRR